METTPTPGIGSVPPAESANPDLRALADQVAAKHHAAAGSAPGNPATPAGKRGRGRPPTPGSPRSQFKVAPVNGQMVAPAQAEVPFEPGPILDSALVRKGVVQVLKTVDQMIMRRVYRGVITLGGDGNLAKEFASEAGLKADNAEMIADMAAEVCEKYQLILQYAPEIFLCIGLGTWGLQVNTVFSKLDDMAKVKADAEKRKTVDN